MNYSTPEIEFGDLATLPDHLIDLGKAALLIAKAEYPELDIPTQLQSLDSLASASSSANDMRDEPLHAMNQLSNYLFDELGFQGNSENYHDPRNSYLNDMLTTRLGIPISLSLLYVEVGKRLGIPVVGVGMPGHFLVKHVSVDGLFIDPFSRGIILSEQECLNIFFAMRGSNGCMESDYLRPVTNREFIERMLRNLNVIYSNIGDDARLLRTLNLLVVLRPKKIGYLLQRTAVNYRLGRLSEAKRDLSVYTELHSFSTHTPDVENILAVINKETT